MTAYHFTGAAPTPRRRRRALAALAVAVLLALGAALALVSLLHRPKAPVPAQVLSAFEIAGSTTVARDCGYSQRLPAAPARSLWLFCDTPVYVHTTEAGHRPQWALRRFISGSTAALSSGEAGHRPGRLAELPTPGTGRAPEPAASPPAPFLPAPAGLITLSGQPCDAASKAYPASWISGVARIPGSPDLLVTFNDYCVLSSSPTFLHEGFGLVSYDPATNTLSSEARVFPGIDLTGTYALGSPVFSGGYLYLFGPACMVPGKSGCTTGTISLARVGALPLDWANSLGYQWWSSGSWTSDPAAAASVIKGASPTGVHVADFSAAGHGFVLVEQTDVGGGFSAYQAQAPAGSWKRIKSGRVPCGRSRGGLVDLCRAIFGHPELSSRTRLALSYFDPGAGVHGHVMIADFPW